MPTSELVEIQLAAGVTLKAVSGHFNQRIHQLPHDIVGNGMLNIQGRGIPK